MKTKNLIILGVFISVIGIYFLIKYNSNNYSVTSNMSKKIESEWKSSEIISRMDDSNEKISFKKIDIIVVLNEKIIGDTNSMDPLIIDLSRENIIIKNGIFSKFCDVNFTKDIHQNFKVNTSLTTIETDLKGKIIYSVKYKIKGISNYEKAEAMITNIIMNDIYKNAKEHIKFGLPDILTDNLQTEISPKLMNDTKLKL